MQFVLCWLRFFSIITTNQTESIIRSARQARVCWCFCHPQHTGDMTMCSLLLLGAIQNDGAQRNSHHQHIYRYSLRGSCFEFSKYQLYPRYSSGLKLNFSSSSYIMFSLKKSQDNKIHDCQDKNCLKPFKIISLCKGDYEWARIYIVFTLNKSFEFKTLFCGRVFCMKLSSRRTTVKHFSLWGKTQSFLLHFMRRRRVWTIFV